MVGYNLQHEGHVNEA